jgi:signal transduction histidine kinase
MDQAVPLERYGEVLAEYLRTRGERQLFEASLISNQFVEAGVGPDEIIALHVEALDQALHGASFREQARAIGDSHQFLLDVMIAYGLKYREYFELKQQENERAAEARDELLATVAHELRSPLAAATTSLDVAVRSLNRGNVERLPPLIGSAKEALSRLSRLTANLVRVSQSQPTPLSRDPVDLVPLLTEACDWVRPAADEKGVALTLDAEAPELWVLGDTDALLSIIGNLLSNAVRYTPSGGRVDIAWGTGEGAAWVEIRDTGIGMTPDVQERIFEKFFRAREARHVEAQGLGLGLTLVHDLVLAHEGLVEVQSTPNQGSSFRVTLPLVPADDLPKDVLERGTNGRYGIGAPDHGVE